MKRYSLRRDIATPRVDYSQELNSEQLEVITHKSGPMLVLAGAGTGKTRTVTYRVAWLVERGVKPANILLLTFTNKAAREMMRRSEALIGRDIRGLWGGTFHHIGNIILRRHAKLLGYREGFSILDRADTKELFESCITEISKKDTLMPKGAVLCDIYSYMKNTLKTIEDTIITRYPVHSHRLQEIMDLITIYERKKFQLNLMDFDDLLFNFKRLLDTEREIKRIYSERFQNILVDEYQDTNTVQAEIIDLLSESHKNVMVVGDDAQSIYSFRGANFDNIIEFPKRYPHVRIFKLTTNYRSTQQILTLANESIARNERQFLKELHSVNHDGEMPFLIALQEVYEQAEFIASRVIDLSIEGNSLSEIAVLYRSHYQSMEIQMEFQRRGIPFEVRSGLKFFEQAHIKDILSYLKVIANPFDEISWKRLLKMIPKIGNATADKIWKKISNRGDPLQTILSEQQIFPKRAEAQFQKFLETVRLIKDIEKPDKAINSVLTNGYEDYLFITYPRAESRLEDIEQMANYASRYTSIEALVNDMTLQSAGGEDIETLNGEEDRVVLSSVHQAKGLEWKIVFIVGLNEGLFPSAKAMRAEGEEEERRLFYVAVTRAKEEVYLCHNLMTGASNFIRPSRFIKELPENLYEKVFIER